MNLSRLLSLSQTYAITLKGAHDAKSTQVLVKDYLDATKRIGKRYNAKLEYFYAIANHAHSGWHAHIICNVYNPNNAAYIEPVKDRKAYCLYIVANLVSSRSADYQRVRRYGASSLLNKQNLKSWFKTRRRLFEFRTRQALIRSALECLKWSLLWCLVVSINRAVAYIVKCCGACSRSVAVHVTEWRPLVERPPPNTLLMKFFTFQSVGG